MISNPTPGIYFIWDLETEKVVYIGYDKNIALNVREKEHLDPRRRYKQLVNKVIQLDRDRYEFEEWVRFDTEKEAKDMEKALIEMYKPEFNIKHNENNKNLKW